MWRWVWRLVAAAIALASATPSAAAQAVALQIKPRMGDTLRMRLDQRVEMSTATRVAGIDSTTTMTTATQVFTRAVVLGSDASGTIVQAVTDSIVVSTNGAPDPAATAQARRRVQGIKLRVHVAPDGTMEMLDRAALVSDELRAVVASMPATLPRAPVEVGSSWTRAMVVPLDPRYGTTAGAVKATFHFDSLSKAGDLAYVSMSGVLNREGATPDSLWGGGAASGMTGSVTGTIVVDRRRGWMSETHAAVNVASVLTPPPSTGRRPMRFKMTITQWLRVVK